MKICSQQLPSDVLKITSSMTVEWIWSCTHHRSSWRFSTQGSLPPFPASFDISAVISALFPWSSWSIFPRKKPDWVVCWSCLQYRQPITPFLSSLSIVPYQNHPLSAPEINLFNFAVPSGCTALMTASGGSHVLLVEQMTYIVGFTCTFS